MKDAKHKHVDRCVKHTTMIIYNIFMLKILAEIESERERERERERQTDRGRTSDEYNHNLRYLKIIDIRIIYTELWRRRLHV